MRPILTAVAFTSPATPFGSNLLMFDDPFNYRFGSFTLKGKLIGENMEIVNMVASKMSLASHRTNMVAECLFVGGVMPAVQLIGGKECFIQTDGRTSVLVYRLITSDLCPLPSTKQENCQFCNLN